MEQHSLAFKNSRMEDTHFKVSSTAPLGKGTQVRQWTPWWQMDSEQWRQADVWRPWSDQQWRPDTSRHSELTGRRRDLKTDRNTQTEGKREGEFKGGRKKGVCTQGKDIKRRMVRGGSVRESESEQHSGSRRAGWKERERTQKGGGRVFLSSCALSQRGQWVRLFLDCLSKQCGYHGVYSSPSHSEMHAHMHVQVHEPPKAFNNALIKALATIQQQNQHSH